MKPVTDPALLAQLNGDSGPAKAPVSDPELLKQLNAEVDTTTDVAKAAGVGLGKGVINFAGLPGDVAELGARGIDWATRKVGGALGVDVQPRADREATYGSKDIQKAVEGYTGEFYKPQTTAGKYAEAVGESVGNPASYIGPGGLLLKAGLATTAGLGGEAARSAAEGTGGEGAAQVAGNVAGGVLPLLMRRAPRPAPAPTNDLLRLGADSEYAAGGAVNAAIHPQVIEQVTQRVRNDLYHNRVSPELTPATQGVIGRLEAVAQAGAPLDMRTLSMVRQELSEARRAGGQDAMAANILGRHLDDTLDNIANQRAYVTGPTGLRIGQSPVTQGSVQDVERAVGHYRNADGNFAAAMRDDLVTGKTDAATLKAAIDNSGLNGENKLRQQFSTILHPDATHLRQGFSPEILERMRQLSEGTRGANLRRQIGNRLGGGGGFTSTILAMLGAGALGPIGAAAGFAGTGVRMAGNAAALRRAQAISELTRMDSPLGRNIVQPIHPRGLPTAAVLRALATSQPLN